MAHQLRQLGLVDVARDVRADEGAQNAVLGIVAALTTSAVSMRRCMRSWPCRTIVNSRSSRDGKWLYSAPGDNPHALVRSRTDVLAAPRSKNNAADVASTRCAAGEKPARSG